MSDIEGTLTTGSSWKALRRYYQANYSALKYNLFFAKWVPYYLLVRLGWVDKRRAMTGWMVDEIRLFRGLSLQEFQKIAEWVVAHEMWPKRRKAVLSELEAHRQSGAELVVVSSAYQPIVDAFARRVGATPIGSNLTFVENQLVGVELPITAYHHKADAVRERFKDSAVLAAYGDTTSDVPMMELSASPAAVHPDDDLLAVAQEKSWRIIQ